MSAAAAAALIPPIADASLDAQVRAEFERRRALAGSFGVLETLAVRLALVQGTAHPRFSAPQLAVFAADHGLVVEGVVAGDRQPTAATVRALLTGQLPLAAFARLQGFGLAVVDAGAAEDLPPLPLLVSRKIAHGTRNARAGTAMSTEQAHAAMRAGMEIGDSLGGDAVACAGIGVGSAQSAALVLSCMTGAPLAELNDAGPRLAAPLLAHRLVVLDDIRSRHGHLEDPVELLAAVGGFEVAMMAGLMLVAASRRRLIITDGLAACAALVIASAIAPPVVDYCVQARSNASASLERAVALVDAPTLPATGIDSIDGTGAMLAWPLLQSAAALLGETARHEGEGAAAAVTSASREASAVSTLRRVPA